MTRFEIHFHFQGEKNEKFLRPGKTWKPGMLREFRFTGFLQAFLLFFEQFFLVIPDFRPICPGLFQEDPTKFLCSISSRIFVIFLPESFVVFYPQVFQRFAQRHFHGIYTRIHPEIWTRVSLSIYCSDVTEFLLEFRLKIFRDYFRCFYCNFPMRFSGISLRFATGVNPGISTRASSRIS